MKNQRELLPEKVKDNPHQAKTDNKAQNSFPRLPFLLRLQASPEFHSKEWLLRNPVFAVPTAPADHVALAGDDLARV
ncbi:MAG: hypothetical protein P8Y04_01995, partial [Desulfobulbaceae bacterium]